MKHIKTNLFIRKRDLFFAISVYSHYNSLVEELKANNYVGLIHIDFLLKLGACSNRFIQIEFNGTEFIKDSIALSSKSSQLLEFSNCTLKNNPVLLESSILSQNTIQDIKRIL